MINDNSIFHTGVLLLLLLYLIDDTVAIKRVLSLLKAFSYPQPYYN